MKRLSRTLLMLLFVSACSAQTRGADEAATSSSYYPLGVGNTWDYRVGENRFTLKVTKIEKVGAGKDGKADKAGKTNAARLELIVNGKSVSFEHLAVTSTAVMRYSFEGKTASPPIPFLKLPPTKGATWNVESKVDGQLLKGAFTIVEDKEAIKVPAGAFKTVTVRSKGLEVNGVKVELTYYFAEKVGMVKQVIEYAGQKAIVELEKFEPAK